MRGNTAVEFGVVPEGLARLPGALHKQITTPGDAAQHAVGFCSQITAGSSLPFRVRFILPQIATGLCTTQIRHSASWASAARAPLAAACVSRHSLLTRCFAAAGHHSSNTQQRSSGTARAQKLCRLWLCCRLSDWRRGKVAVSLVGPSKPVSVVRGRVVEVLARRSRVSSWPQAKRQTTQQPADTICCVSGGGGQTGQRGWCACVARPPRLLCTPSESNP